MAKRKKTGERRFPVINTRGDSWKDVEPIQLNVNIPAGNPLDEIVSTIQNERSEPSDTVAPPSPDAPAATFDAPGTGGEALPPISSEPPGGMLDNEGILWSENLHESPPRKKGDGKWAKKRGSKGGAQTVNATPIDRKLECRAAAQTVVLQIFTIAVAFGGPEWAPQVRPEFGQDEREALITAWENYFYDRGIITMPAWLALVLVMGSYALPRLMLPKYLEKIAKLKTWIMGESTDENLEDRKGKPMADNAGR